MLPTSGPILWSDVAREIAWPANVPLRMNTPEIYALIGKTPGSIIHFPEDFYGKAFLDIIPDNIKWDDFIGEKTFMSTNRAFSGLAFNQTINVKIKITNPRNVIVIQVFKNDIMIVDQRAHRAIPIIRIGNGDKLRFYVNNLGKSPYAGNMEIRNATFHDELITSIAVKI